MALIRQHLPEGTLLALVAKADAYGHGLVPISRFAVQNGADWVCVATVQEGIALRDAGILSPILVLSPILPIEAEQAVFYDFRISVERVSTAQAISLAAVGQQKTAQVHLEVDTGLARFGCRPDETVEVAKAIGALPNVDLEGLSQHFVDSGFNPNVTGQQKENFDRVIEELGQNSLQIEIVHGANSAGTMKPIGATYNLVRVGILAYGIDPYDISAKQARPVLSWHTRVTALRSVPCGETIGYSATYCAPRDMVVATLGVGYGDGYPRSLSSRGIVCIRGAVAKIVGLVCMDQLMIDVTDIPGVDIGDQVELVGPTITVERLAQIDETNCHEIITRIMSRVPRRYLY